MRYFLRLFAVAVPILVVANSPASAAELRGHGGPVRAIAVTPDGTTAITGSFDASAIIWSLDNSTAQDVLRFHKSQVNAVLTLPQNRFATAGEDGRIAIWKSGGVEPVRVLEGHEAPVVSLALSPDGETLASAAWDRTVRLWPLSGGEPVVLNGHEDNVNAVAYLADGTLVSAGYDAKLMFWKDQTTPVVFTLPSPLNALAPFGDDALAVGGADGRVRIVGRDGMTRDQAQIAQTAVIALAASPDGEYLAAAGLKGAIAVLEGETLQPVHNLVDPGSPVWSLAFTPDGETLLTGGSDRLVRRWDMETGAHIGPTVVSPADPLADFQGHPGAEVFRACVACHTLSPEGNRAGPTLYGIFGRRIASVPGYSYSPAFREMDIVWTPETVSRLFELGPSSYTPGTKMPEQTIGSAEDRADLIRFLEEATRPD